jgi:hypothetical protein
VHAGQRQNAAFVLQEHDALLGGFPRQSAVGLTADDVGRVVARVTPLREPHLLAQDPQRRVVHELFRDLAALHQVGQEPVEDVLQRHLDALARQRRLLGVAHAEHPVGLDEAPEPPLVPQDVGEQRLVLPGPFAVHAVVGAHDGSHTLVHDPLEVGQVHLVQRPRVGAHVDLETRVLHGVEREVLHDRHHMALDATRERRAHLAQMVAVLAIGFLRPAPGRMMQQVDAGAADHVGAMGTRLASHHVTDPLLEVRVPAGAARAGSGKRGRPASISRAARR